MLSDVSCQRECRLSIHLRLQYPCHQLRVPRSIFLRSIASRASVILALPARSVGKQFPAWRPRPCERYADDCRGWAVNSAPTGTVQNRCIA